MVKQSHRVEIECRQPRHKTDQIGSCVCACGTLLALFGWVESGKSIPFPLTDKQPLKLIEKSLRTGTPVPFGEDSVGCVVSIMSEVCRPEKDPSMIILPVVVEVYFDVSNL